MKFSDKTIYIGFWSTLVIIGVLQFFQFPKYLDLIPLLIALALGAVIITRKFR